MGADKDQGQIHWFYTNSIQTWLLASNLLVDWNCNIHLFQTYECLAFLKSEADRRSPCASSMVWFDLELAFDGSLWHFYANLSSRNSFLLPPVIQLILEINIFLSERFVLVIKLILKLIINSYHEYSWIWLLFTF